MKHASNENGIALVTALLLTLISLGVVLALLYLVQMNLSVSSAHKAYKNSLEASYGGVDVLTKELLPAFAGASDFAATRTQAETNMSYIDLSIGDCLDTRLKSGTAVWGVACASSSDVKDKTDATFTLNGSSGQPNFMVFTKITDTIAGNSDMSSVDSLDSASSVAGTSSGVSPVHIPSLYTIEIQGERQNNPEQKARLSVLYAY